MNLDRGQLKKVVKGAVQRSGVSVTKRSSYEELRKGASRGARYPEAMAQLEAVWRNELMPGLAERKGRVELLSQLLGTEPAEAMHLVYWLDQTKSVDGVVCEMGCASGATSALIANEIADLDRAFWLFDSFQGLSKPTAEDVLIDDIFSRGSMDAYEGSMAYPEAAVRQRLRAVDFPEARTHIVPGYVPASLDRSGLPESVAFAYIDFDLYAPIKGGLEWLHERVPAGGRIMIDDYGWFSSGAATAVDEFAAAHADSYAVHRVEPWVGHFICLEKLHDGATSPS